MKKNAQLSALALGLCLLGQTASAANLNPKGTGQVLIYPYYTVNNDLATLLSVVNTTSDVKAVKVRILEADNGIEVLDFNLYLSPFDVWTAALVANAIGAELVTADNSCAPFLGNPQPLLEFAYVLDPGSDESERMRDGHIQILDMATVIHPVLGPAAVHINGVPSNCGAIAAAWLPGGEWFIDPSDGVEPPTGGLYGHAVIIDVAEGTAMSYRADTLDDFYADGDIVHSDVGDLLPNLSSAKPQNVFIDSGEALISNWSTGEDAISALFSQQSIFNEYVLNSGINAKTEWIITFPTKGLYVNGASERAPFTSLFSGPGGACEEYVVTNYSRESQSPNSIAIDPAPPRPITELCWNTNVLHFYNSASAGQDTLVSPILGSTNITGLNTAPYNAGWIDMIFPGNQSLVDTEGNRYEGYPVTGFAVQTYTNFNAQPGLLAQYAAVFSHSYRRVLTRGDL